MLDFSRALYGNIFVNYPVVVALRPQVMTDILLQTKFYKYNKTTDIL